MSIGTTIVTKQKKKRSAANPLSSPPYTRMAAGDDDDDNQKCPSCHKGKLCEKEILVCNVCGFSISESKFVKKDEHYNLWEYRKRKGAKLM